MDNPNACYALPSGTAAARLVNGDMSAAPDVLLSLAMRTGLVTLGVLAAGEKKNALKYGFAGACAIEVGVLVWAWGTQR